jgi:hypothetical protein
MRYQRVKNLGNYETERLELVATVDEDEHPKEVFFDLKETVEVLLEIDDELSDYE